VVAAWLASTHRSAAAARRTLTPILRDYPIWVGAVLGLIALIWLLSGVDSTRAILFRLALIAMAAVGLYELRRNCIAEHPDASLGEMSARVRTRVSAIWRGRERTSPEPEDRRLERLERLGELHERGVLSDEEFAAEKTAALGSGAADRSDPAA
jgi:Short C-terminal domain